MYSNISVFYSIYSADFLQVSKFYFKCLIIHELFLLIVIPPLHLIHICIFLSCVLYTGSQYSSFYCIFFYFFILFSLTLSSSSFTPYCVVFLCILYIFLILPIFSDFHLISVNFLPCILWMVLLHTVSFLMNESWSKIPPAARIHVGLTDWACAECLLTFCRFMSASVICWTLCSGKEAFLNRKLDRVSLSRRKCFNLKPVGEKTKTDKTEQVRETWLLLLLLQ